MGELRQKDDVSAKALEFLILTAARTGEVLGAKWSEIDLEARLWVIPAQRMKAAREHRTPLSDRAMAILEALPRDSDFLFPGERAGKAISARAMPGVLHALRGDVATVHGFRSGFRDWAAEQTSYPHELCEVALAHSVSDKTQAAYLRSDQMVKRRRLMQDWSDFCLSTPVERGAKVTPIRVAAQ